MLVQDRAPLHRGQWTQEVIEDFSPWLQVYEFPPYAPELNPVEHLWAWTKDKQLVNFVPEDLGQLAIATEHVIDAAEHDQGPHSIVLRGRGTAMVEIRTGII